MSDDPNDKWTAWDSISVGTGISAEGCFAYGLIAAIAVVCAGIIALFAWLIGGG